MVSSTTIKFNIQSLTVGITLALSISTFVSSSPLKSTPVSSSTTGSTPPAFVFSPYIDIGSGMQNNGIFTISANAKDKTVNEFLQDSGVQTVTLAFASGVCGEETWANINADDVVKNGMVGVSKDFNIIVSAGGQAGSFSCKSSANFTKYVNRYKSKLGDKLIGFDFDIEGGNVSPEDINNLVQYIKEAQTSFPSLRFSFTIPSLGKAGLDDILGPDGHNVTVTVKENNLENVYFNLMVMDYGANSVDSCTPSKADPTKCDMGASAAAAATAFSEQYKIDMKYIELTPMIGVNDASDEVFTLEDVATLTKVKGLGGIHFWSLNRDQSCQQPTTTASDSCNSLNGVGDLAFTKEFLSQIKANQ